MIARIYIGSGPLTTPADFPARARTVASVLVHQGISGATIFPALGVWQGQIEESMVVEIVTLPAATAPLPDLDAIADALRATFSQDSVLVVILPGFGKLVERAP